MKKTKNPLNKKSSHRKPLRKRLWYFTDKKQEQKHIIKSLANYIIKFKWMYGADEFLQRLRRAKLYYRYLTRKNHGRRK